MKKLLDFDKENKLSLPESLNSFFIRAKELNECIPQLDLTIFQAPKELCRGISAKKLHEISILTPFIKNLCDNNCVLNVVDIGSGLSYLGQFLALNSNIQIIGLESDEHRVYLADKRLENQLDVLKKVKNVTFKLYKDCEEQIMNIISENSNANCNLGLVSLHSCGDLTPQMLKLFANQSKFKFLAAFSCCYHSMKLDSSNTTLY